MQAKYALEILGGVLIVVSSLVGEEMRRRSKWVAYVIFGVLAVLYSVVAIKIDRASEKRELEAAAEARDSRAELLKSQNDLIGAQAELIAKSNEITQLNEEIAASVTGGNEFAYLQPMIADDAQQHRLFLIVAHKGNIPSTMLVSAFWTSALVDMNRMRQKSSQTPSAWALLPRTNFILFPTGLLFRR